MRVCEKCGLEDGGTLVNDRIRREVVPCKMAGGYYAYLCMPCCNASNECADLDSTTHGRLRARYEAYITAGNAGDVVEVVGRIYKEEKRLFALAKAWVHSGKPGKGL